MSRFRRLTPQQRSTYRALRVLGSMLVTPQDARPLRALQARGLVRYRRIEGLRYAVLITVERKEAAEKRRLYRAWLWFGWSKEAKR